jgi:hypothetical protein
MQAFKKRRPLIEETYDLSEARGAGSGEEGIDGELTGLFLGCNQGQNALTLA